MPQTATTCTECDGELGCETYTDSETYCKECYEADYFTCERCDTEFLPIEDYVNTPDGGHFCASCWDETYTICVECDKVISLNDAEAMYGDYYCQSCFEAHYFSCPSCGRRTHYDDARVSPDNESLCDSCWSDSCGICEECDEIRWIDDLYRTEWNSHCRDCRPYGANFSPSNFSNTGNKSKVVGSRRRFGLELETDCCDGYTELEGKSAWGAKDDCTVSGKEFYSAILWGDAGLKAVEDWAKFAKKKRWQVNSDCGYHLHIDVRNEDDNSLLAIAYAYRKTQAMWCSFVNECRQRDSYCHTCSWSVSDLTRCDNFMDFLLNMDTRYNWFNICSYHVFKSFEIRLHQGTCDSEAICNWVKAHTRFADWAAAKGLKGVKDALDGKTTEEMFELIAHEAWKDDYLTEYYHDMAENLEHGFIGA